MSSELPYVPLPGGLTDPRRTAGAVFDTVAEISSTTAVAANSWTASGD